MPLPRPAPGSLTFTTCLNVSLRHVHPATRWKYAYGCSDPASWPFRGCRDQDGMFMYAHDENEGVEPIPDDLWVICEFARAAGASWIRFDAEMEPYADLPLYSDPSAVGEIWWIFDTAEELADWKKAVGDGVTIISERTDQVFEVIHVTFEIEKAKANQVLGYEVGEDEWLER